jgi:hypothetical protein
MKKIAVTTGVVMAVLAPAMGQERLPNGLECLAVDEDHSPEITLTGRVTKQHLKPESEDLRVWDGFYLKLDKGLAVNVTGGREDCFNWREVPIADSTNLLAKWNNSHVKITGTLSRPGSAVVYPPLFIDISKIEEVRK